MGREVRGSNKTRKEGGRKGGREREGISYT